LVCAPLILLVIVLNVTMGSVSPLHRLELVAIVSWLVGRVIVLLFPIGPSMAVVRLDCLLLRCLGWGSEMSLVLLNFVRCGLDCAVCMVRYEEWLLDGGCFEIIFNLVGLVFLWGALERLVSLLVLIVVFSHLI
jgi:hypothetical protein